MVLVFSILLGNFLQFKIFLRVGSEIWSRNPDIFVSYQESYSFKSRCDEVVNWFKKFEIDFGTLYFNEPDHIGHDKGPESIEYWNQVNLILAKLI